MNRSEYIKERYALDAAYEAAAIKKEIAEARISQQRDHIVECMEEITQDHNSVLTFEEYMDELSFYFDNKDYEDQADFIKNFQQELEEREGEE